jgi:hypothetical protein
MTLTIGLAIDGAMRPRSEPAPPSAIASRRGRNRRRLAGRAPLPNRPLVHDSRINHSLMAVRTARHGLRPSTEFRLRQVVDLHCQRAPAYGRNRRRRSRSPERRKRRDITGSCRYESNESSATMADITQEPPRLACGSGDAARGP